MANILINGFNSKTGGGKSILNNYLSLLMISNSKDLYYVITPNKNEYNKYSCSFINVIEFRSIYKLNISFPVVNYFIFPNLIRKLGIDIIFNLGDIPIRSKKTQLYLFDWPYAAYPESSVWRVMDLKSYLIRKIKLFFFKKNIHFATQIIAQTITMKNKLSNIYGLENVAIVPNAVSLENLGNGEAYDFNLPANKTKLLYLTYYYPHKNLEILIPLARLIKEASLPYCLVITIESEQHKNAGKLIYKIKENKLDDIIINIGPVCMKNVPSLYTQCDALLMPSLLESFSGTYVEAMFHKKPILTSDIDFAIDVCGESAFYFNPNDALSIFNCIRSAFSNEIIRTEKIEAGKKRLGDLLTWKQAFIKFQELIEKA